MAMGLLELTVLSLGVWSMLGVWLRLLAVGLLLIRLLAKHLVGAPSC